MFDNLQPIASWTWTWLSGPMIGQSNVVTTPNCIIRPPQVQGTSAPSLPTIAFRVTPQGLLLQCQSGEVIVNGRSESTHLLQDGDVVSHGEFSAQITFSFAEDSVPTPPVLSPQREQQLVNAIAEPPMCQADETSADAHDHTDEMSVDVSPSHPRATQDSLEHVLTNQTENQELNQKLLSTFKKFRQIAKQVPDMRVTQQVEVMRSVDLIDRDLDMLDRALKALVHSSHSATENAENSSVSPRDTSAESLKSFENASEENKDQFEHFNAAEACQAAEELAEDALQTPIATPNSAKQDPNPTPMVSEPAARESHEPTMQDLTQTSDHADQVTSSTHDHADTVDDETHEQNAQSLRQILARLQVDSVSSVELNLTPNQRLISNSVLLNFDSNESGSIGSSGGHSRKPQGQQGNIERLPVQWTEVPANKLNSSNFADECRDDVLPNSQIDSQPHSADFGREIDRPTFPEDSIVSASDGAFQANEMEDVNQLLCRPESASLPGGPNSSDVEFSPETMSEIDSIRSKLEGILKKSANAPLDTDSHSLEIKTPVSQAPSNFSSSVFHSARPQLTALPTDTTSAAPVKAPAEINRFSPASFINAHPSLDQGQATIDLSKQENVSHFTDSKPLETTANFVEERKEAEMIDAAVSEPKVEFTPVEKVQSSELVTAALMRDLYEKDDFEPEAKALPTQSRPGVPTQPSHSEESPANSQPETSHHSPANGEQDSENMNDYMNELMKRLRGGSGSYQAPATTKTVVTPVVPKPVEVVEPVEEMIPLKESEYLPRQRAPERNANMDALRKLANDSTRDAVSSFADRQAKSMKTVRIGAIAGGTLMSAAFFAISQGFGDPASLGGMLSLLGTFAAIAFHVLAKAKQDEETTNSDSAAE